MSDDNGDDYAGLEPELARLYTRIDELEAERDKLRQALRPFASLADHDDARDYITVPILMSAIRRAQAALSTKIDTPETQPTSPSPKVLGE